MQSSRKLDKMLKQLVPLLPLILIFFLYFPAVFAQSPAPAPAPSGPPNVVKILKKAGHFSKMIRLLKRTKMDDRIFSLLNNSNPLTIFAPTDEAFAHLKSETLKSLTFQQRIQLVQFHVINNMLSFSDFETVTNPLSTQAGDNRKYMYPLNVTMTGNQVNISTGIVNATVTNTIYTDNLLALYEVDKVLLPLHFYVSPPPVPPPPAKPVVEVPPPESPPADDSSDATHKIHHGLTVISFIGYVVATIYLCL
ncbi:fasciclin-like arabinogalactan protein 11 [Diospyros lotus]|uniref:fasciclin-like arabinogalactan protein 11 n=1 Tax=Diospyros lotus TaxID=55363 RepID=UPI0022546047|nr:fasciclin-like arabinogalactan protein 11 [Diospyros lotus]